MTVTIPRHVSQFAVALAALALAGCATTDQAMTAPPESRVVMEFRGVAPSGPVVVVVNAQVGVTAKPVGLDVLNPAVALTAQASDNAVGQGDVAKTGGGNNPAGTEQAQTKQPAIPPAGSVPLPVGGLKPASPSLGAPEAPKPADAPATAPAATPPALPAPAAE